MNCLLLLLYKSRLVNQEKIPAEPWLNSNNPFWVIFFNETSIDVQQELMLLSHIYVLSIYTLLNFAAYQKRSKQKREPPRMLNMCTEVKYIVKLQFFWWLHNETIRSFSLELLFGFCDNNFFSERLNTPMLDCVVFHFFVFAIKIFPSQ